MEMLEIRSKAYCVAEAGLLEKRGKTHALQRHKIGAVAGGHLQLSHHPWSRRSSFYSSSDPSIVVTIWQASSLYMVKPKHAVSVLLE